MRQLNAGAVTASLGKIFLFSSLTSGSRFIHLMGSDFRWCVLGVGEGVNFCGRIRLTSDILNFLSFNYNILIFCVVQYSLKSRR